ncbi:protein-glutamate methylesterase/protein-glutamine glutaminase [Pelagicoccus mobilis]|uniref:Protein-glutamate methylesterase/protein-glutamine glutaminase n=1 Tax=Pelagicoccus mobilis TaxID=415221 RepID=A0A934VS92_9BACT|nr:chemotaxis response regulator protein-glutamate methylesterase [Pelagicoccus mobilis]MBK1878269.1 chemotaxis response regulator protein-glutamate methylesterase [Pelagicoccus mobilis]
MPKPRVLIVDDTSVVRRLLSEVIERDDELDVAGTAPNGKVALMKLPQLNPDIITLDIEMPEMDGIETLREIRKVDKRTPVIMLSSLTRTGAEMTFEALSAGATDYLLKPAKVTDFATTLKELNQLLLPKLKAHVKLPEPTVSTAQPAPAKPSSAIPNSTSNGPFNILCIGTSTGGPNALETIFHRLQEPLSVPAVIVQHMPPVFTRTLAERLDKISPNRVFEGEDGQLLEPGCAYIAPGGKHMEVKRVGNEVRLHLHEGPPENSCRPAVDTLFRSVASTYKDGALGIILTGMGQDGLRGCEALHEQGSRIISQDQKTSLIWGMPRAVTEANLAHQTLPLDNIPGAIYTRMSSHGPLAN